MSKNESLKNVSTACLTELRELLKYTEKFCPVEIGRKQAREKIESINAELSMRS